MKQLREKKLLLGFGLFFILTLGIGIIGLLQIDILTKAIKDLERRYLIKERLVLEMKTDNAFYAMGVRNYVSWQVSKYLQSASIASDINVIRDVGLRLKQYIKDFYLLPLSVQETQSAGVLKGLVVELEDMGEVLIGLVEGEMQERNTVVDKERINRLLVSFENKFYKIDDFLANILSKGNLKDMANLLDLTYARKNLAILILVIALFFSAVLGFLISFFTYRGFREERRKREWLTHKMIRLEEEERRNLSAQIHDQLSQDLSALKIYLGLIDNEVPVESREQKEMVAKGRQIIDRLIERGHNISELLRPPQLDDLGLVESVEALIDDYRKMLGCRFNYYKPDCEINVAAEFSLALYRVVQESLTNITKHAKAQNVTVSLQAKTGFVNLAVVDDGVGFDYSQYSHGIFRRRKEDKLKLGLQGLKERIEFLGGKFTIDTVPDKGTKVQVELNI